MKQIAKRILSRVAAAIGPHRWVGRQPRLWILMYHRILPMDDSRARLEEPGMMVTPQTFLRHLEWLAPHMEPVCLADWIAAVRAGDKLPPRSYAITFDDGWSDNYQYAFPILREARIPATIFLVSQLIGTDRTFWPNRLAELLDRVGTRATHESCFDWLREIIPLASVEAPNPAGRAAIIRACKSLEDRQLQAHLDRMEAELGVVPASTPALLSWTQIDEMAESGLVDFGSHTRHHSRLINLPKETMEAEIRDSRRHLESKLGRPISLFCYPNGDYNAEVQALVDQNYAAAVTADRGVNTADTPFVALRRVGLHEASSNTAVDFFARLSAWV